MKSNSKDVFFALVRVGLWTDAGANLNLDLYDKVDWGEVCQLAEEQSVIGVVLAGIEHSNVKPPQELLLQWIGEVQMLEHQNNAMNHFIAELVERLRNADIYTLLVKGQGIAQCYDRPLWRACGDVDFLLSNDNYKKAKKLLLPLATSHEEEAVYVKHLGMTIDSWVVELHGTLRSNCLRRMDRVIDEVQNDVFNGGNVRFWQNGKTQVFLPSFDNDVFFVFTHIIKHFFREGVGLRQICDWCRLLWACKDRLNHDLLEKRLLKAGIMTEWKTFAAYVVKYLGMPVDTVPLYSSEKKWLQKAEKINAYILSVGNFGHNRENIYKNFSYVTRKVKAFGRRISDAINIFFIFPIDSMKVFYRTLLYGMIGVAKGI